MAASIVRVGQIRKNSQTQYLTDVPCEITTVTTTLSDIATNFNDICIETTDGDFLAGVTYYVRVDIKRISINRNMGNVGSNENDPHVQNIQVKLFASNSDSFQTIGDLIVIEPYDPSGGEGTTDLDHEKFFIKWCEACQMVEDAPDIEDGITYPGAKSYFDDLKLDYEQRQSSLGVYSDIRSPFRVVELIFTPYINSNRLVFQLRRVAYDYNYPTGDYSRIVEFNDFNNNHDVASVVNILPANFSDESNQFTVNKIGIQSNSGSLIVVNGEAMRIGKSNVLELNSGIPIKSVGFAAPGASSSSDTINDFLLDYIYTQKSEG